MEDFANVMLRTAFIPVNAQELTAAGAMLDMAHPRLALRDQAGRNGLCHHLARPVEDPALGFGPIPVGSGGC